MKKNYEEAQSKGAKKKKIIFNTKKQFGKGSFINNVRKKGLNF